MIDIPDATNRGDTVDPGTTERRDVLRHDTSNRDDWNAAVPYESLE
jgi:hypothetical protein